MHVANLQLEGLLMAVASINNVLVAKGILSAEEIDGALRKAEAAVTSEDRVHEDMSPSNRDAICFPIRFLQLANRARSGEAVQPFSELARGVGLTKEPYNDQM